MPSRGIVVAEVVGVRVHPNGDRIRIVELTPETASDDRSSSAETAILISVTWSRTHRPVPGCTPA